MLNTPDSSTPQRSDITQFLEPLMSGVSTDLVETEVRPEILSRVRGLPGAMCCGTMGFEFHLEEARGTCGIGFGLQNRGQDLACLSHIPIDNYGAHAPAGQDALHFLAKLRMDDGDIWRSLKALWLEYDIGTDGFPGLFFSLPGYRENGSGQGTGPDCEEILHHLMNGLPGPGDSSPAANTIARLLSKTVGLCKLNHVGWMIGRGSDKLKVDLRADGASRVVAVLERLGLTSIAGNAEAALKVLHDVDAPIMVQFDVGEEIAPKVGLQFYSLGSPARLSLILGALQDMGLCSGRKAHSLEHFAGCCAVPASSWPAEVWRQYQPAGRELSLLLRQVICHFKLTLRADAVASAKCYINGHYVWYDRNSRSMARLSGRAGPHN